MDTYVTVSEGGVEFTIPAYPGYYPAATSDDPKVRAKEESQQKAKILEQYVCTGFVQDMMDFIAKAVDEKWLAKIEDEVMGFTKKTTIEMLDHLETRGGTLDYIDTKKI